MEEGRHAIQCVQQEEGYTVNVVNGPVNNGLAGVIRAAAVLWSLEYYIPVADTHL